MIHNAPVKESVFIYISCYEKPEDFQIEEPPFSFYNFIDWNK